MPSGLPSPEVTDPNLPAQPHLSAHIPLLREAQRLQSLSSVEFTAYSGPIPHPDLLQRYNEIYPGAAKQILDDFVQESAHRRIIESKVVNTEAFSQAFGSISAGLIGLLGVAGGLWLAYAGRALGGLSAILATLASLVGVYLHQNRTENKAVSERDEFRGPTR